MKTKNHVLCGRIVSFALLACVSLRADVTSYSLFKTAVYHQTSPAQPASVDAPDAYYCGVELFTDTNQNEVVTNAAFFNPVNNYYALSSPYTNFFDYGSPFFPDKTSLDAAFPAGDYHFIVNDTNDSADLFLNDNSLYTTSTPYFTGSTWSNLLSVDPSQPLFFTWDAFVTNAEAAASYIYLRCIDLNNQSGPAVYIQDAYDAANLPSDAMAATNIGVIAPPAALQNGINYRVELLFSGRYKNVGSGFRRRGRHGRFRCFHLQRLTTIAPTLAISNLNGAIVLSWPGSAANYELQYAAEFAPKANWSAVDTAATLIDGQFYWTNDLSDQADFFQLFQVQN